MKIKRFTSTIITIFFFFNDTATTEIYTLSLHDALPILQPSRLFGRWGQTATPAFPLSPTFHLYSFLGSFTDRKSTRLNSSHSQISYAVFCLKKKNKQTT